jgi:sugar O-acyltransferase (sialic acid O-acetyltransferase NeuD family)
LDQIIQKIITVNNEGMNMANLKKIAIFGSGGFGLEVATLIEHINAVDGHWELIGFFDDKPKSKIINGYNVLGGVDILNQWDSPLHLVLALGMPKTRRNVKEKIVNEKILFPVLIHPSVIMGSKELINIDEGCIICAGNILTTNIKIGKQVILNLACTVGHECEIGEFSSFMPSCNISGEVKIGKANYWGTGAKVINRKTIGNNVIVGAGAVIVDDIPDNVTVAGIPAKVIKKNL